MNQQEAERVIAAVGKALENFGEQCGIPGLVVRPIGRPVFEERGWVRVKLEIAEGREDGLVLTHEATDFLTCADMLGLHEEDLGRWFELGGLVPGKVRLIGYRSAASARKMVVQSEAGRVYTVTLAAVREALAPGQVQS